MFFSLLGISEAKAQLSVGVTVGFVINYENGNYYNWNQTTIVDTLPTNLTYVSCSGGNSCSDTSGEIAWNIGTLPAHTSGSVTLWVYVNSCVPASFVQQASIDVGLPFETFLTNAVTDTVVCPTNTPTRTPTATSTTTYTITCTPTASPTNTFTGTFTLTFTPTSTNTITLTFTPTNTSTTTPTDTITYTPSNTYTPTYSPTQTPTPTFTMTSTQTSTNTISNTPTVTYTPTYTFTITNTPTMTQTSTYTNTFTQTFTPTQTNTFTQTYSPTNTPTATFTNTSTSTNTITNTTTQTSTFTLSNTPTFTFTPTSTKTFTLTFTFTHTPTSTNTPTVTNTPTPYVAIQKTASKTSVQALDTVSYTITLLVTNGPASSVVVQDSLPAQTTFQSFTSSPVGTITSQNGSLLTWTLPPSLPTGTYKLTYQTVLGSFVQGGSGICNEAWVNNSLGGPTTASACVTLAANYTVNIGVYNEAGELVKNILTTQYSQPINNIQLTPNTITSLHGQADIYYSGNLIGYWDGNNTDGNPVSNGTYYIKIENIDNMGVVTSVTQTVVVSRSIYQISSRIYNEAGEVVRNLYAFADDPGSNVPTLMTLSSNVFQPTGGASTGNMPNLLTISLSDGTTMVWDGMLTPVEKCNGGRSKSVTPPAFHTPLGVWSLVEPINPSCLYVSVVSSLPPA